MSQRKDKNDLTEGVVWKKLLGFFFPILFGLLFQQLYNTVDAVIVGKFLGSSALAAVGGSPAVITNLVIGFCTGLNSGATVIISQKFGAGDGKALSRVLHTAFLFCCGIGLFVSVAGWFLTPWALRTVNNPEDIMGPSVTYLRIYFIGAIPMLLYNLGQGTLQAVGNSRRPLVYLITSCCLNIVLDLLFVAVLKMGVAGVAWATVISMCVCAGLVTLHLLRTQNAWQLVPRQLRIDTPSLKRVLRIGLPAGFQGSMYSLSNLIIQAAVNSFGTTVVASWTATGKLDGFYWVTSNAFGVAICAFVGQCIGAGKLDRMRKAVYTCLGIALGTAVCISTLLLAIARPAFNLILDDRAVTDGAIQIMWYFVPFYFTWSFVEVLSGTFRGAGDTLRPMIIVMLGTCIFRVVWIYTAVAVWHTIAMVSYVYVVSWVITGTAFIFYWRSGKWLKKPSVPESETASGSKI